MPVEASALSLMYRINNQWYEAKFSATEQDSISADYARLASGGRLTLAGQDWLPVGNQ